MREIPVWCYLVGVALRSTMSLRRPCVSEAVLRREATHAVADASRDELEEITDLLAAQRLRRAVLEMAAGPRASVLALPVR